MALTEENLVHVPGMLSRYVRLSSGVKAHYMTSGESGPAVVLLHGGIPGSSGTAGFRFMAPFLGAHGFRVYCPDMPGFGLTEDPLGHYTYGPGAFVDFLHEFVNAVALDEFHLGGNSMGCQNTVYYTVAHPERVRSFALIAGGIGDLVPREEMLNLSRGKRDEAASAKRVSGGFDGTDEHMRQILERLAFDPSHVDDELVQMRAHAARLRKDHYAPQMKRFLDEGDPLVNIRVRTRDRFDRLTIPGIYLWGLEDVMYVPEAAHLQEDALPNVQFFYPERTGHQGQTDRPELHNQVFLEFFRDGKVSWETAQEAGVSRRRPVDPRRVDVPASVTTAGTSSDTAEVPA